MAAVLSTPVKAWLATLNAGGFTSHGVGAGRGFTVTFCITQAWEGQVPCGARYGSNVSLASPIDIFASNDGGATFDTLPLASFAIPTTASSLQIQSVRLTTGIYAIRMIASSPSVTFFVLTQEVVTAVSNL